MSSSRRTTRKRKSASAFELEFWGVRGSIPSPGASTKRYGGNTPCLEVRCGGERLIFDLGTGARALGEQLQASGSPVRASVFLSHYHHDHLQGFPFFAPLFSASNTFVIHGPRHEGRSVKKVLAGQMTRPYHPVSANEVFRAQVDYRDIAAAESVTVGGATVSTLQLNHPGGSLAYRVDYEGRSLVYATDVEHGTQTDEALASFARETDVLIYDAMYTDDEYHGRAGFPRTGWGHSTWQAAVKAVRAAKAKTLVLFHHDPARDDSAIESILAEVRKHRPEAIAAREALVLKL